jgi:hypothetical protein
MKIAEVCAQIICKRECFLVVKMNSRLFYSVLLILLHTKTFSILNIKYIYAFLHLYYPHFESVGFVRSTEWPPNFTDLNPFDYLDWNRHTVSVWKLKVPFSSLRSPQQSAKHMQLRVSHSIMTI